jgi:hypothetical protein
MFLPDRAEADHISEPPTLADLAAAYLSDSGMGERVNVKTGQITNRRTAKHFADVVTTDYPYTADDARDAYKAEQQRRAELERKGWQRFFAHLRHMSDADLIAYIVGRARASLLGVVDHTEEQAPTISAFDKHLYATRLKCAKQHLAWRGLKMPAKPTKDKPVTPSKRRSAPVLFTEQLLLPDAPAGLATDGWSVIARLQMAKAQREAAHVE